MDYDNQSLLENLRYHLEQANAFASLLKKNRINLKEINQIADNSYDCMNICDDLLNEMDNK